MPLVLLFTSVAAPDVAYSGAPLLAHSSVATPLPAGLPDPARFPVSHFVFLVMENHAYDNYFATYCRALGPYCDFPTLGPNLSRCIPLYPAHPTGLCHRLYRSPSTSLANVTDLDHGWVASHTAYDNGRMDDFYLAERKSNLTFGYFDGSQIPTYWDYAEQYGLGDAFFSSTLSYSLPNHWYILAGEAPPISETVLFVKAANVPLTADETTYLNESNRTRSIADILVNSSVTWKHYDWSPVSYDRALAEPSAADTPGSAFSLWNPLMAKRESYSPALASHFVNRSQFFEDATAGQLPNVSWVIPPYADSDHPAIGTTPVRLPDGEAFLSGLLDTVERSPEWNSTAVFVTWDDYGGFYDHVAPPISQMENVSFRVPLLVVSPYTAEGYVSSYFAYFESFLRTIEWRFGLPSLNALDADAPLLLRYFDVNATPRAPFLEPTNASELRYPQPYQPLPAPLGASAFTAAPQGETLRLEWSAVNGGSPRAGWLLTYGPTGRPAATTLRLEGTADTWTVAGLTEGRSYSFSLRSFAGPSESAARTMTVTLTARYPVTFEEAGLPAGVPWSVTLHGSTVRTNGPSAVFSEPNGTYNFTVAGVPGFTVRPATGLLSVAGLAVTRALLFSSVSPTGPPPENSTILGAAGPRSNPVLLGIGVGAVAAVAVVTVLLLRRRRPRAPVRG